MTQSIDFSLERFCSQRTNDTTLTEMLQFIAKRVISDRFDHIYTSKIGSIEAKKGDFNGLPHRFRSVVSFQRVRDVSDDRLEAERELLKDRVVVAGMAPRFNKYPWVLQSLTPSDNDRDLQDNGDEDDILIASDYVRLSQIQKIEPGEFFDHLYGREAQIRIVLSAIQAAIDSGMDNRFHVLLHGPTGCGKTDLLRGVSRILTELGVSS